MGWLWRPGRQSLLMLSICTLLLSCTGESAQPEGRVGVRPQVSYLEATVAPCIEAGGVDPCLDGRPDSLPYVENATSESAPPLWPHTNELPTFVDMLIGRGETYIGPWVSHLVVRGTVQPSSTRCELYPVERPNYLPEADSDISYSGLFHYHCFVDVAINDYLVGEGPAKLTVGIHRHVVYLSAEEEWSDVKDFWVYDRLEDPGSRTAAAYEGRELVLFLRPTWTISVETWTVDQSFGMWFVYVAADGEVRVTSGASRWARTDEQRSRLDMSLTELVAGVKQAAGLREGMSGPFGDEAPIPMVVTDANRLQDFYKAVGAVYEGERATVLPPPAPFQETPPSDPGDIVDTTTTPTSSTTAPSSTSVPTTSTTVPTSSSTVPRSTSSTSAGTSTTVPVSTTLAPTTTTTVPSSTSSTQPPSGVPGVPREVTISESWVVSWQAPDSGGRVVSYDVEAVFTRRGGDSVTETASVSGLSHDASGWVGTHGAGFTVRVRASNPVGTSPWTQPVSPE